MQLDTVCVLTIVTSKCLLNFPVHSITNSHKWIIKIIQLAALHKPVDFDFLPPTNHTVYVDQYSQACLGTVWANQLSCLPSNDK